MAKPIEPIPNNEECERTLKGSCTGILVMCHDEEPYAVPINHAYSDGRLYFHCAATGRKLDMIRANPNVCYVVNRYFGDLSDFTDGVRCHGNWESVIAYGKARVIDDPDELRDAFSKFMAYYSPTAFEPGEDSVRTTRAIVVEVKSMTARREVPREGFDRRTGKGEVDIDYWSWSHVRGNT
jgi:nitroimidazol reductase NimA-like FMN-containing flavoprotein (pyridoxamine 5'-phosphate oxidase superfamily)